uniref:DZF domain-containing protein n=1 Tax=Amphilophus citrinellus TaxID=61819 RepID=A0A3Q0RFY3_AMPCI
LLPLFLFAGPYDRYVLAKHSEVYPSTEELEAVQTVVSHVECALKTVSDQMDQTEKVSQVPEALSEEILSVMNVRGLCVD